MIPVRLIIRTLLVGTCITALSFAAQAQPAKNRTVVVGTKPAPPFVIKNEDGSWEGITIDLWKEIARELNYKTIWEEYDLNGLLKAVETKKVQAAAAALTITPQREIAFDFSHPFYVDGLGIAVPLKEGRIWLSAVRRIFSAQLFQVLGVLALVLLIFGFLVWLFERRNNPEQFGGGILEGIASGFWWSAVTMTTVGYGDKAPRTLGGRLVALVWMFTAIIIISSFTAAITSAITVSRLASDISGPEDLKTAVVGTVEASTSEHYLKGNNIRYQTYGSIEEGLDGLKEGAIEAFVYDAPLLQYKVNRGYHSVIRVLPNSFEDQQYGLAFPTGSRMREDVNRVLLEVINSQRWPAITRKYLGR